MSNTVLKPNIKWFQNKDKVTVEIDHRDLKNEKIDITSETVSIKF